jgi:hypothetical protein
MSNIPAKKSNISLFKKIEYKFKHGLVLQSIRNILTKVGINIAPYYWVQEGLTETEEPQIDGNVSDYTLGFLETGDLMKIAASIPGYSADALLADLKAGHLCLGLKYNSEIASFMWINLKDCSYMPVKIILNSDEAYLTSMYTVESFRGKNLAPYLRYKSYEILKKMGRTKIYSVSEFFNSAAIRYKEKLKAKNLKLVFYLKLFNKLKWSFTLRTY